MPLKPHRKPATNCAHRSGGLARLAKVPRLVVLSPRYPQSQSIRFTMAPKGPRRVAGGVSHRFWKRNNNESPEGATEILKSTRMASLDLRYRDRYLHIGETFVAITFK